jgi:hypothetical protein
MIHILKIATSNLLLIFCLKYLSFTPLIVKVEKNDPPDLDHYWKPGQK